MRALRCHTPSRACRLRATAGTLLSSHTVSTPSLPFGCSQDPMKSSFTAAYQGGSDPEACSVLPGVVRLVQGAELGAGVALSMVLSSNLTLLSEPVP